MPFQVVCPQCLSSSLVSEEHAGARGRCKACRGRVRVQSREAMRCAHCTISLIDQPVVTDEEGRSYCKICWLDEIEPQRRASEQKDIVGCALCGNLFPADQVRQVDNVFVCTPCATRTENRTTGESLAPADAGKLPVPMPEVVESNSMLDRSPVLKLARGLLRGVSAGTR